MKKIIANQALELDSKTGLLKKSGLPTPEKVSMVQGYKSSAISKGRLIRWAGLAPSTYYYKHKEGKPGAKPGTCTLTKEGERKANQNMVEEIEGVLRQEFCCYRYRMMSAGLKERGFVINHKKVYRLMKAHRLLVGSRIQVHGAPGNFIRFRKIRAEQPLQYLSMDIQYVHVHGDGRNALLLTILDIYSRKVLLHMLRHNNNKRDMLLLLSLLLLE